MSKRLYKSGSRWALWRYSFVDNEFITRLHIIKTPWFAVCLHWINKPDPEPYLHDHPVSLFSIVLRGWYAEKRPRYGHVCWGTTHHRRRWWNFLRATDAHTIIDCKPNTLTLAFMGPKVREWGYHTPDGWVHWKTYSHAKYRSNA